MVNDYTVKQSLLFRVSDVIIAAGEQRGNSNAMQTINVYLIYKFGFFAIILKLGVKMSSFPAATRLVPAVIRTEWTLQEPAAPATDE